MAQEKDPKEASDGLFVPPDFDEKAFIRGEFTAFRTTVILFVWGLVVGAVGWGLMYAMDGAMSGWYLALAACAAGGAALPTLFRKFGADISAWKRGKWIGTGFLFFFTFVSMLIILANPPISDFSPPHVALYASPPVQVQGSPVELHVFVSDNAGAPDPTFELTRGQGAGLVTIATTADLKPQGKGHYTYTLAADLPAASYQMHVLTKDAKGHTAEATETFAIGNQPLFQFNAKDLKVSTDVVSLEVKNADPDQDGVADFVPCTTKLYREGKPCVRQVMLANTDGTHKVVAEYKSEFTAWVAAASYAGWTDGNNTFEVRVEMADIIAENNVVPGGILSAGTYTIQHTAPIGIVAPKGILAQPTIGLRQAPAPVLALGALALLGLAAVVRTQRDAKP